MKNLGLAINLDGKTGTPAGFVDALGWATLKGLHHVMVGVPRKTHWPTAERENRKGIVWQSPMTALDVPFRDALLAWKRSHPLNQLTIYNGCLIGEAPDADLIRLKPIDLLAWRGTVLADRIVQDWMGGTIITPDQAEQFGLGERARTRNRNGLFGANLEAANAAGVTLLCEPALFDQDGRRLRPNRLEFSLLRHVKRMRPDWRVMEYCPTMELWVRGGPAGGDQPADLPAALSIASRVWLNAGDSAMWEAAMDPLAGGALVGAVGGITT